MGTIHQPPLVLPITAVFTRFPASLEWVKEKITANWGKIVLESPAYPFEQTGYYDATMGTGLRKIFYAMEPAMEASRLVEMKHQSNAWEDAYAECFPQDVSRPVNIDPGYIDLGKLVLASSKDFAHRIYMADGIYAEITLFFRRGKWCGHDFTFPDYRAETYHPFFDQCRQRLAQLR
ncbi:MAG: DUF4416 family protein [Planctomycetia bacterium]|nr:DUF4416 family protein [Planctomycetia bacterium]